MSDIEFEAVESGASLTYPMSAGNIKKGGYCMIKDKPTKVVEYTTSKTGKHGHAKAHIVGIDIFSGKKLEDICPTSHNMSVPHVNRTDYQLLDITGDNFVSLLNEEGTTKDDLKLPVDGQGELDDVAHQLQQGFADGKQMLVSVLAACGIEKIVAVREISS